MKGCDVVLHLAALIAIPYSYHSPDTYVDTNVKGTLNVVQAARELGVAKVVHTSTSEVYGTARFVPITEQHPLQGQSPYSASKIGADQIGLVVLSVVRRPGGDPAALQYLWPTPVGARRHPDHHHPDRQRQRQIKLGAVAPDARLQLRRRHRGRLHRRADVRAGHRRGHQHRQQLRDFHR